MKRETSEGRATGLTCFTFHSSRFTDATMNTAIIPTPRSPISVRVATLVDLSFIDSLQKKHTKMVGWMPTKQIEGKIAAGHVLIAEETADYADVTDGSNAESSAPSAQSAVQSLGYCISQDRY